MRIAQAALSSYLVAPGAWRDDWAWGVPLIILTVVVHVLGLGFIYQKAVRMVKRRIDRDHPMALMAAIVSSVTLFATGLHAAEAAVWAACYQFLGNRPDFKSAMLYSLGAMTTYGHGGVFLEERWQLLGAIEALNGSLLFGLTTAFLIGTIQKCHQIVTRDPLLQPEIGRRK
jgi:hypothetical protein